MKKLTLLAWRRFWERHRQRQLHAALARLPVYQFERLAFTNAANLSPLNETSPTKSQTDHNNKKPSRFGGQTKT